MLSTKRKKRSELSGAELLAVQAIKNLITKWEAEGAEEADDQERSEAVSLQTVLDMLSTKLDGPQTYSFSSMSDEHLDKLKIFYSGELRLKTDSHSRSAKTDSVGEAEDWSADRLYRHLCLLEGLVPRTNEAATRLWINAFFFRVAFMLSGSSKFVLNVEQNVLSGFVNFTAISTTETHARYLLQNPRLKKLPAQDHALFVTEAKGSDQRLASHIPRALGELYACAKHLERRIIRGALTNGHEWIFFFLRLNEGGSGGEYFQSKGINLMRGGETGISREDSSLIAAIIADWILHSHNEIGNDDYFTMP